MGQPAAGVMAGRPRITEIDVQQIYFIRCKIVPKLRSIPINKIDIVQTKIPHSFHRDNHGVGHSLHRYVQGLRVLAGCLSRKSSLTAAKFQPHLFRIRLKCSPPSTILLRILN